jgi:uncharacterized protein
MLLVSKSDLLARLRNENPWWQTGSAPEPYLSFQKRDYFERFIGLVKLREPNRAVVLMGARRVGKTVMLIQAITDLINSGARAHEILYASLDSPAYFGQSLEALLALYQTEISPETNRQLFVFFDEIQYLKDWEIHLKSLVDSNHNIKFIASGSAAAALRMKSNESGAGRFTDFALPSLTFAEFLRMRHREDDLITRHDGHYWQYHTPNIALLNEEFIKYLNFGGYPEIALSQLAQEDQNRFLRSDIIDKALLRDLPSLFGISDTQELNSLFAHLAFNTAQEFSLENTAKSANIAKNTLKKYLDYLEAAFLIKRVPRIDRNARGFQRAVSFKVFLTNASLRSALFGQLHADDEKFGSVAETAVIAHWLHVEGHGVRLGARFDQIARYARWDKGEEVDFVFLNPTSQKPSWAIEIKWTDRHIDRPEMLSALIRFAESNPNIEQPLVATTRSRFGRIRIRGFEIELLPTALYCYSVGKGLFNNEPSPISKRAPWLEN